MLGLKADSEQRYIRFFEKIKKSKKVYVLSDGEMICYFPSHEFYHHDNEIDSEEGSDKEQQEYLPVIPFWSNAAYPRQFLKNGAEELENYSVVEIDLQQFYNLLCRYEEIGYPVGIEWNQHGVGKEIEASFVLDEVDNFFTSAATNPSDNI